MATQPASSAAASPKKAPGTIVVNLARCRYPVVRDAALSLGFSMDADVENLAATVSKAIEQPSATTTTTSTATAGRNAAGAASASRPAPARSVSGMLSVGSNLARPAPLHDGVFAMLESRRAHIAWSDMTVTPQQVSLLSCWQRVNHFPGIAQTLSRKVPLAQTMMRAWKVAPRYFSDLVPLSFSLKRDAAVLRRYFEAIEFTKQQQQSRSAGAANSAPVDANSAAALASANPFLPSSSLSCSASGSTETAPLLPRVFIFKPNGGCMGHDIKLTCKPLRTMERLLAGNVQSRFLKEDEDFVVQVYIDRPLLVDRRKFDLRVYVLLLSVAPELRVLIHREGLVRLCATEYVAPKPSNVRKATMHLTNFAVNKKRLGKAGDATTTSSNTAAASSNARANAVDAEADDNDEDDDGDVVVDGGGGGTATQQQQQQQQGGEPLTIGEIKRDFSFLNAMLDSTFAAVGGAAEIWRRIDRTVVLTLIAAHPELEAAYRKATMQTNVLLRRAALLHLKELREREEALKKQQQQEQQQQQGATGAGGNEIDDEDADDDDEECEAEDDDNDGGAVAATATSATPHAKATAAASSSSSAAAPIPDEAAFVRDCGIGRCCFELLGYDLLLTDSGHPIVMEVNHGPSLETGADIDLQIKTSVLRDVFRHVTAFLPRARKPQLRSRRYLQRVVTKAATADLVLNPPTGFRVAHPLVAPFASPAHAALAEEYAGARAALQDAAAAAGNRGESQTGADDDAAATTGKLQRRGSFSAFGSSSRAGAASTIEAGATGAAVRKAAQPRAASGAGNAALPPLQKVPPRNQRAGAAPGKSVAPMPVRSASVPGFRAPAAKARV